MVTSVFNGKYFYEVQRNIRVKNKLLQGVTLDHEFATIRDCVMCVKAGYQFNGASPRWEFMTLEIGTPQGRGNYLIKGFAMHDAMYQFGKEIGLKRENADKILYQYMVSKNFPFAKLYYYTLKIFGGLNY